MLDVLRSILGDRAVAVPPGDPRYAPHPTPLVHAVPRTREEVAEVLRAASADGFPVVPVGGNTAPSLGAADDARPICLLSTEMLDRVVAFDPADQTLTVEAGASLEAVRRLAAPHRLFPALEAGRPERSTVGGALATAREGAWAARYGPARDQLLGVVAATGDGVVAKAGGRVVKNVTGYDLCRLYTGSRGALAVLLEATLRLRPIPETAGRAAWAFAEEGDALAAGLALRDANVDASQVHVLSGSAARDLGAEGGALLVATFQGFAAQVEDAGRRAEALLKRDAQVLPAEAPPGPPAEAPETAETLRITAPPASWRALGPRLRGVLAPPAGAIHDVLRGVRTTWRAEGARLAASEAELDRALAEARAHLDAPWDPAFRRALARFPSQILGGLALMRRLKAEFDPRGVLNPGRTLFG